MMNFRYFVIFSVGLFLLWDCPGAVAENVVEGSNLSLCNPEGVHLAFGDTSREMIVMWTTQKECSTEVQYAAHPWHLNLMEKGVMAELTCENKNSNKSSVFMHKVTLKNLDPGTTVFYHPISSGVSNSPFYFKVPDFDEPSHFIVFNELAVAHQKSFVKALVEEAFSHSFTSLFYLSQPQTLFTLTDGESLFDRLKEPAVSLPLMIGADWGQETGPEKQCGRQIFSPPGLGWPTPSTAKWYSHDVGPIHIIRYSPRVFLASDGKDAKDMQSWMLADLTAVNQKREQTPWIIAMGLDPMYCSEATHSSGDCARNDSKIRHGLEDIFYSFAVDLVIEQQDGPYERTWPHYKGIVVGKSYVEPAAPVEVIMGLGKMSPLKTEPTNATETKTATESEWTAMRLSNGGESYGRLTVANASHLLWELLSVSSGSTLDEIWLVQSEHGNFSLSSLPHNVSHQINQSIIAMGGKPGTYDFIGSLASNQNSDQGEGWSKYSLWFGLSLVGAAIGIGLGTVTIRSYLKRRRGASGRRWQETDRHGSAGHFYSVASDTDSDGENENDFEIDMFERSSKSGSKLLTSY